MQHIEQRVREVHEHQARFREQRRFERIAQAARADRRGVRRQVGERIIRIGRAVAGEGIGSPALSG